MAVVRTFIAILLLSVALLQLGYRGWQRVRTDVPMWDFASVYSSARTWIHGRDPYDFDEVSATWRQAAPFSRGQLGAWALVYPPSSLLAIAPLAVLPAKVALLAWLAIAVALLSWQFAALAEMARLRWRDPRAWILVAASLAAAPLQFGILSGQLSLPAISLCIIAFCYGGRARDALAGALLGVACAIKPQIAAPFVIYYLFVRRWEIGRVAILIGSAIGAASMLAMQLSHPTWLGDWLGNVAATGTVGGVNDYSWAGPFRDEIMDLKLLLVSIRHDPMVLRIVIECIVIGLLAWFVRSHPRTAAAAASSAPASAGQTSGSNNDLLTLAALSGITLLPVYHRVYDAALLTMALAWALSELDGPRRRWAIGLMVPMLLFLVPFDLVRSIGYRAPQIMRLATMWWWQSLIAPHYAWGLLALTVGLLATLTRVTATAAAPKPAIGARPALATDSDDDEEMILAR